MSSGIKLVFGGGFFGRPDAGDPEQILDLLNSLKVEVIDTAQAYGDSEKILGEQPAGKRFTIDTKHPCGMNPGGASEETIIKDGTASLERLGMDQVDIYYLHCPHATEPLESTLAGVNELYKRGAFKRFGISNYKPQDVQALYDLCKEKDYVLPSVYQGNYNPFARKYDSTLFPTLRKLGISFYAYSPLAGGFFAKTKQQVLAGAGRFGDGSPVAKMYKALYAKPALMDALSEWSTIAEEEGVTPAELAYRWVRFNSILSPEHGDAIIFGGRTSEQIKETVGWLQKGPVSEKAATSIDHVWEKVEHESPMDNMEALSAMK